MQYFKHTLKMTLEQCVWKYFIIQPLTSHNIAQKLLSACFVWQLPGLWKLLPGHYETYYLDPMKSAIWTLWKLLPGPCENYYLDPMKSAFWILWNLLPGPSGNYYLGPVNTTIWMLWKPQSGPCENCCLDPVKTTTWTLWKLLSGPCENWMNNQTYLYSNHNAADASA